MDHENYLEDREYTLIKIKQKGAVAKSFMTRYLRISSYIRKLFLTYDFVTTPF
jgi:hypothetical protein